MEKIDKKAALRACLPVLIFLAVTGLLYLSRESNTPSYWSKEHIALLSMGAMYIWGRNYRRETTAPAERTNSKPNRTAPWLLALGFGIIAVDILIAYQRAHGQPDWFANCWTWREALISIAYFFCVYKIHRYERKLKEGGET